MDVSTGEGAELLQPDHGRVLHSQLSAVGVQEVVVLSRAQHHTSNTAQRYTQHKRVSQC